MSSPAAPHCFVSNATNQVPSERVGPPRVGESAVQMECKLHGTYEVRNRCWIILISVPPDFVATNTNRDLVHLAFMHEPRCICSRTFSYGPCSTYFCTQDVQLRLDHIRHDLLEMQSSIHYLRTGL